MILCQKLHICTYDRQNSSGDQPPLETLAPYLPPKVEVLELPLETSVNLCVCVCPRNERSTT